ncbi:MAG: nucleoside hydrolase [Thermomicrobiales bacterium]
METPTPPQAATPILLDCDPGVDDAMAILWGLADPRIDLVAIGTVWGNVNVELTTKNAIRLLEIGGHPDIPVAMGASKPLLGPEPSFENGVHGKDGQGDVGLSDPKGAPVDETAAAQIVRLANERPGELTLVAVGPMTNLAIALALDPGIATRFRQVVLMGGAFQVAGNVSATGEANIWHDPEAAQMVMEAGWPLTIVGLDVTEQARVTETMLRELAATGNPSTVHLQRISDGYLNIYTGRYGSDERQCPMHDALALGIAIDESLLIDAPHAHVDVELNGTVTRGATIADLRSWADPARANARVALKADGERFVREWVATMAALPAARG